MLDDFPFDKIAKNPKTLLFNVCREICANHTNHDEIISNIQQVLCVYGDINIISDDYIVRPHSLTLFAVSSLRAVIFYKFKYTTGRKYA